MVVSRSTVFRYLRALGLTYKKKTVVAAEAVNAVNLAKRRAYVDAMFAGADLAAVGTVHEAAAQQHWHCPAAKSLYFLDESGFNFNVQRRRHARAPRGAKAVSFESYRKDRNHSLCIGVGHSGGIVASQVIAGAFNGASFERFVAHKLAPAIVRDFARLRAAGEVDAGAVPTLVMDNASIHKGAGTAQALARRGIALRFLAPYSPTMNPCELVFARIKAGMRVTRATLRDQLAGVRSVAARAATLKRVVREAAARHAGETEVIQRCYAACGYRVVVDEVE